MKVLLSGYEGSKHILPASSFLVDRYLPRGFEPLWLNYGDYKGDLYSGGYQKLAERQLEVKDWSRDIDRIVWALQDEFVIFALDDYLLSGPLDLVRYQVLADQMTAYPEIVCARLCISDFYKPHEIEAEYSVETAAGSVPILRLSPEAEYSSTTQYCIWRREFLFDLLRHVGTPWEFEVSGSRYLNSTGKKVIGSLPALDYNPASCLSSRWNGINVSGMRNTDLAELIRRGLLNREQLTDRGREIIWGSPEA